MGFLSKNRKIIILNEDNADMQQLSFTPIKSFLIVISGLTLLLTPTLAFIWFYFTNPSLKEVKVIREDNKNLAIQIQKNQKNLDILYDNLKNIQTREKNFREMVNLPPIPNDIRMLGTGGEINKDQSSNLNYLLPINDFDLKDHTKKIEYAQLWTNLENLSYSEILNKIKINPNRYKAIPAIIPIDKKSYEFTSKFGMRTDPLTGKWRRHDGHDFSAKKGTPVYAAADGVIKKSKYFGSYGNFIEIDHGYGYKTIYAHLNKRKVKRGQSISRGDIIGTVGNTGKSTAPHLHYEIKVNNKRVNPKNYYFTESHI